MCPGTGRAERRARCSGRRAGCVVCGHSSGLDCESGRDWRSFTRPRPKMAAPHANIAGCSQELRPMNATCTRTHAIRASPTTRCPRIAQERFLSDPTITIVGSTPFTTASATPANAADSNGTSRIGPSRGMAPVSRPKAPPYAPTASSTSRPSSQLCTLPSRQRGARVATPRHSCDC